MDEIERRIIIDMLERTGWNQTEAPSGFLIPLSTPQPEDQALGMTSAAVAAAMSIVCIDGKVRVPTRRKISSPLSLARNGLANRLH